MPALHKNRVKMSVTGTPGTGTITLNAASSAHQSFATAYGANATVDVLITDGTAWEVARNCTYTHSGTTVTRGTLEASSTGSAISLTSAAIVEEILTADTGNSLVNMQQEFIVGLVVTKNTGANTLDISAGYCFDPSSGKIISYAGATGVSAGTLGASQWNQVYIYDNAGTATIEVVNNAAPPSTTYCGTARQGGTGSNRRWIGSFLTTSGSAIYAAQVKEIGANQIEVLYLQTVTATPFRVVNNQTQTTFTAASLVGCVPRYVAFEISHNLNQSLTTGAGASQAYLSADGTNTNYEIRGYSFGTGTLTSTVGRTQIESDTPQIHYKVATNCSMYLDIYGYRAAR